MKLRTFSFVFKPGVFNRLLSLSMIFMGEVPEEDGYKGEFAGSEKFD